MSTETAASAATHIDIQKETTELIQKVDQMGWQNILNEWVLPYGIKITIAIAIFIIGKWLARMVSNLMGRAVLRSSRDEMLQGFVRSIAYFLGLLIVVIAALSQVGINTSSLVALIGAAGLAIGLALQNSLQNFAAGVMILIFKPFRKGDFIESAGISGTVQEIGLLVLEIRTGDNKTILIPNGKVFADSITNYSANETRRIDFIFDISYEADIARAKDIIAQILNDEAQVLKAPEPTIVVGALSTNSVQLFVRPWVNTPDYWSTHFSVLEKVKLAFDREGIAIPYHQLDVHVSHGELVQNLIQPKQ